MSRERVDLLRSCSRAFTPNIDSLRLPQLQSRRAGRTVKEWSECSSISAAKFITRCSGSLHRRFPKSIRPATHSRSIWPARTVIPRRGLCRHAGPPGTIPLGDAGRHGRLGCAGDAIRRLSSVAAVGTVPADHQRTDGGSAQRSDLLHRGQPRRSAGNRSAVSGHAGLPALRAAIDRSNAVRGAAARPRGTFRKRAAVAATCTDMTEQRRSNAGRCFSHRYRS